MENKYYLGKCDYNESGRNNCKAFITWKLEQRKEGLRFSMCAEIWNPRETNLYTVGQCVDEVAAYFPNDEKAQRMVEIWKRWHLNDMKAGSAVQEQYLKDRPIDQAEYAYPKSYYEVASEKLFEVGLNPDADGYQYGHAWKFEQIPGDVIAEIQSW